MPRHTNNETKKKDLLARKEKLIQEIKYYEKRIEDYNAQCSIEGNASSDSDDDISMSLFDPVVTSITDLKQQNSLLKTCLKATQELTSLSILQTHDSIMVETPVIDGVSVASEPGTWREVAAECYIDLVSFSISFYTHQPSRKFAAASFCGLKVLPVKRLQEAELSNYSLLASAACPSDAIDVLRSYAVAYRSRRTTLHRLAKMFTRHLYMEPLPDGGFVTKYANLLQISWHLENNTSTVAPFHHKMKFQIEYVEESYLKIIKQLYKQLANPSLDTDERTLLLSKLIGTCGEAHPNLDSESDLEPDTQNKNNDQNTNQQTDRQTADEQVMAPPKTIPKRTKPKGKENTDDNRKSVKRSAGHVEDNVGKKARIDSNSGKTDESNGRNTKTGGNGDDVGKKAKTSDIRGKEGDTNANEDGDNVLADDVGKNSNDKQDNVKSVNVILKTNKDKIANKKTQSNKEKMAEKKDKQHDQNVEHADKALSSDVQNNVKANNEKNKGIENINAENITQPVNNQKKTTEKNNKNSEKVIKSVSTKKTGTKEVKGAQNIEKHADVTKKQINNNKNEKHVSSKETKSGKQPIDIQKKAENVQHTKNDKAGLVNKKPTEVKDKQQKNLEKTSNNKPKNLENKKYTENIKNAHAKNFNVKSTEAVKAKTANIKTIHNKNTVKSALEAKVKKSDSSKEKIANANTINKKTSYPATTDAHTKNKENITKATENKPKPNKITNDQTKNHATVKNKDKNPPKNLKAKPRLSLKRNSIGKGIKPLLPKNVGKETSKIPQKKLSPAYAMALQSMPLRMSPRMTAKFKSTSDSNLQRKISKPVSNIPRLLKPAPPKSR